MAMGCITVGKESNFSISFHWFSFITASRCFCVRILATCFTITFVIKQLYCLNIISCYNCRRS